MRWDKLFDDLESQLERELTAEELDLEAEEERMRLGRLAVRDRLMAIHEAAAGEQYAVRLALASGIRIAVHPLTFGRDWFSADLVDDSSRSAQCIVPIAAIAGLTLSADQVVVSLGGTRMPETGESLSARLGLPFVLRDLCRRRRAIDLVLEGGALHGTIDRVGRDHVDLAVHEQGAARRQSAIVEYRLIPLDRLLLVRL